MILKILKWAAITFAGLIVLILAALYIPNSITPELGVTNGQLTELKDTPNGVSTQTSQAGKQIDPWPMKADTTTTLSAILNAVNQYEAGRSTVKSQTDTYLHVIFVTPLMRYRDDVEFWVDVSNGVVHIRSNSRTGRSDWGLNRERYNALTELYSAL